jgi:hypothetical protein
MRVATLRKHPTDPDFVLLAVGPELNPTMGRFEPARLSNQHKAYLIHATDVEALGRFLRIHNVAVADERRRAATAIAPAFTRRPFACIKCYDCDYTQRECDEHCYRCDRCHSCGGSSLGAYTLDPDEQRDINTRGVALVKPLLARWPLRVDQDPAALHAAHTTEETT